MDELIKLVEAKTGLSKAQSKKAVEVVLGFLKERLPKTLAGQVDAALKNKTVMNTATDAAKKGVASLGNIRKKK